MQPTAHGLLFLNGAGLAGENQEGRLKNVLPEMFVAKDTPAHAVYHWGMAFQETGKGGLVVACDKLLDQKLVCLAFDGPPGSQGA